MSSVIEHAEMQRLRKAREEHERAAYFHNQEVKRLHYAYCAASVRYRQAMEREQAEATS